MRVDFRNKDIQYFNKALSCFNWENVKPQENQWLREEFEVFLQLTHFGRGSLPHNSPGQRPAGLPINQTNFGQGSPKMFTESKRKLSFTSTQTQVTMPGMGP